MKDLEKSKELLLEELTEVRQRVAELEQASLERERVEERLREQGEFLENTLKSIAHPLYVIDANDYSIKIANSAARDQFGDLMEGSTCYALTHKSSEPCWLLGHTCPLEEVKRTKKPVVVEHIHYDKQGNPRVIEVHGHPIFNSDGSIVQLIEYCIDITERRQSEEELRRAYGALREAYDTMERTQTSAVAAEKLAALGGIAAGIAHEVGTPLNVILGNAEYLLEVIDSKENVQEELQAIIKQTERITRLIQQMLDFSRPYKADIKKPLQINDLINQVINLIGSQATKNGIEISKEFQLDMSPILGDVDRLQQVLLNISINAFHAMPEGGQLVLSADTVKIDGRKFAELRVEDTGVGISPELMDSLFEPFFTTKPEGEGTGLGLFICRGIIEAHGGSIWAESEEGRGTSFIIQLPMELATETESA
jgi:PAS domain S-box-containing protein